MRLKYLLSLILLTALPFMASCDSSQTISDIGDQISDHVDTIGGTVSIDPQTGAITVGGSVGLKTMAEATAISNYIQAHHANAGRSAMFRYSTEGYTVVPRGYCPDCVAHNKPIVLREYVRMAPAAPMEIREVKPMRAVVKEYRDPCGNKQRAIEYKPKSIWRSFLGIFNCTCPQAAPGAPTSFTPTPEFPQADFPQNGVTNNTPPVGSQAPPSSQQPDTLPDPANIASENDQAIINEILANGTSEDTLPRAATGDRAVVFGNNYPGTNAELHGCVKDAYKNALNLVKIDHFSTKNIRLFLNQQCTAANYRKWVVWSLTDIQPNDRRFIGNSSHGSEDTIDGKVVGLICTWDMISTGVWDANTEITYDWWYNTLRMTSGNYFFLNDCCHAGGVARFSLIDRGRRIRSLPPPANVALRIDQAVEKQPTLQARSKELTGSLNPACAENELSEENADGGFGTEAYWTARRAGNMAMVNIVKAENAYMRQIAASQHMQLIGRNAALWSAAPNN